MGLLSRLRFATQVGALAETQTPRALATPFAGTTSLSQALALDDVFDAKVQPVTRAEAMTVPTWARARNLVCPILARQPLRAYRDGVALEEQPLWLSRSKYFPPRLRMLWTIDDCAHYGWSLWVVDRGAPDQSGRGEILDALRIDPARWRNDRGRIVVRGADGKDQEVPEGQYILIPGPSDALLGVAGDTIRGAKNLEHQWLARVKNPVPITELRYTGDEDLEDDEMADIRQTFIGARNDENGVVMVTPRGFEVHPHGDNAPDLFVQGRNAVSLDVARFWSVRASMLDASQVNGSSVDYENNGIGRSEFYDLGLRTWAMPIEEALSQDDVLPRGQYVQFDLTALTAPDAGTGPALED